MSILKSKFPVGFGPTGIAIPDNIDPKYPELAEFRPKFFVDEPFVRNFAVSATDVFLNSQQEINKSYPEPVPQVILTHLSQAYRSLILEHCSSLKESGDLLNADLYTNLDFVWNFCEVMFLSSHPEYPVLPYLIDWIKINFDTSGEVLPLILNQLPDLSSDLLNHLWSLIYSHVFHGTTYEAARLLHHVKYSSEAHSAVLERQLDSMNELLLKKPMFNPETSSVTEFDALFNAWKDECQNRLDQRIFFGNDQLTFICKILCGSEEGFSEAASKKLLTWYEYLVMKLNYQFPLIRPSALKAYARQTLEELGLPNDALEARDVILLHAMEFDIVNVLKEIQNVWDNPWFALHFSDLVLAGGKNPSAGDARIDFSSVSPLRNHFILDYGTNLMQHPSLWQMGVYYLDALPENMGRGVIKECLQRKKPKTEADAQKLLQIAERFSFSREIYGICRQLSLEKLSRGQSQNALLWAIKAGDGPLTTHIVDSILFDGDCQIESSLLDSLRNVIPCADRLLFLQGFCDFRRSMQRKEYKLAVAQLCFLIQNDLIPKRIAHKIFLSIEELSESKMRFESAEISTLMEFLHSKIPKERISSEEFSRLNELLITSRAQQVLTIFKPHDSHTVYVE